MSRPKLHLYRAEQNLLNAVRSQSGGAYAAGDYAEAATLVRRLNAFRSEWRKVNPGADCPYDEIEISLPKKGSQSDHIITFRIRPVILSGTFLTPEGVPMPMQDTAGSIAAPAAPRPEDGLDLGDLGSIASEVAELIEHDEAMNETRSETSSNFFDEKEE